MKRAPHIPISEQEFRRLKRKQFREVMKAVQEFWAGDAYLQPEVFRKLEQAAILLHDAGELLRRWWRKA